MDGRFSREMVHAIVSIVRRGCAWRMLPRDVPPWLTVYPSVRRWRKDATRARRTDTLRIDVRRALGREAEPRCDAGEPVDQNDGKRSASIKRRPLLPERPFPGGVAFVVEQDEPFDPVDVGLFSANGGLFDAQRIPDLVQQFPGFWFHFIR